jgi:hypothetical protein
MTVPGHSSSMAAGPTPEWVKQYQMTMHSLPGWFYHTDLHLFALINELQLGDDVAGDLLEVGPYFGKSTIPLGFMRHDGESLTVIDVWETYVKFEEDPRNGDLTVENVENCFTRSGEYERWYRRSILEDFTANYWRFHDQLPDIRQGLSSEELKHLPAERFRFIHIDGGHEWSTVSEDVDQVRRLLSPGGVVAFDDVFTFGCAGVGAAVWPACASGDLVPIATTNEKLYATRGPSSSVSAASMTQVVEEDSELHILHRESIFGWEVLQVATRPLPQPPPPAASAPVARGAPSSAPIFPRLRRYVPPVLVDVARASNLGKRVRRTLARPPD